MQLNRLQLSADESYHSNRVASDYTNCTWLISLDFCSMHEPVVFFFFSFPTVQHLHNMLFAVESWKPVYMYSTVALNH